MSFLTRMMALVLAALMLAACAGNQKLALPENDSASLQGRTLALKVAPRPKLIVMTPAKAVVGSGLLGAMAVHGASEDLAKTHDVPNPAQEIARTLAQDLAQRYGVRLAQPGEQADLVLETGITDWKVQYGSVRWASYAPYMIAHARLKDARSGKVLAAGSCNNLSAKTERRSYDDMFANNGALLKQDFRQLTQWCLQEIRKGML